MFLKEVLGTEAEAVAGLASPTKKRLVAKNNDDDHNDEIFKLPDGIKLSNESISDFSTFQMAGLVHKRNIHAQIDSTKDIFNLPAVKVKEEESQSPKRSYNRNITKIDIKSTLFKSLPADKKYEILMDIKETRKQNSWAKLQELPVESHDFSSFQMAGLLKRRQVQVQIEEAEKEIGGKNWSLSELESLLSEDGVIESTNFKHAQKIAADENTRFLLVSDVAKAIEQAKQEDETRKQQEEAQKNQPKPSTSKQADENERILEDEYDIELQKAIEMSLENEMVDDEEELARKEAERKAPRKLNPEQRKKFGQTVQTHGLVRGFMMEYAVMNDDDLHDMVNETQILLDDACNANDSLSQKFPNTDHYVLYGSPKKSDQPSAMEKEESPEIPNKPKEIVVSVDAKLSTYIKEDDLFAEIFEENKNSDVIQIDDDVEIASISSSDDDTIEYEVPSQHTSNIEHMKEIEPESGFVSEEGKINEKKSVNEGNYHSENEKFWSLGDENEAEKIPEKSENEKFWSCGDEEEDVGSIAVETIEILPFTPEKTNTQHAILIESDDEDEFVTPEKFNNSIKSNDQIETPKKIEKNATAKLIESDDAEQEIVRIIEENLETPENQNNDSLTEIRTLAEKEKNSIDDITNRERERDEFMKSIETLNWEDNAEELNNMQKDLQKQQKDLAFERNKLNRLGTNITESMSADCKELLKLFGIPFVESPMEAEAQCAFFNSLDMIDGIITDDSDVFLFGAKTVYKNFFVQKKNVMEFRMENIENMFHLNRKKLVQLAMLVGSDYTIGVPGVGSVTALEILAAFPETDDGEVEQYHSLSNLRKFRDWIKNGREGITSLKSKLKKIELANDFPNVHVMKAYLEPVVDEDLEPFSWGDLDVESLIEYTKIKLGWTRLKTEEILNPVMKRLNEKKQSSIKDYFKIQLTKKVFENQKLSKRVQKAVNKMGYGDIEVEDEPKPKEKKPRKRKVNTKIQKKAEEEEKKAIEAAILLLSDDDDGQPPQKKPSPSPDKINSFSLLKQATSTSSPKKNSALPKKVAKTKGRKRKTDAQQPPQPSTSRATAVDKSDVDDVDLPPKRAVRIPETKQVIPQREREKKEQKLNKQKAAEIFKKSGGKKK